MGFLFMFLVYVRVPSRFFCNRLGHTLGIGATLQKKALWRFTGGVVQVKCETMWSTPSSATFSVQNVIRLDEKSFLSVSSMDMCVDWCVVVISSGLSWLLILDGEAAKITWRTWRNDHPGPHQSVFSVQSRLFMICTIRIYTKRICICIYIV